MNFYLCTCKAKKKGEKKGNSGTKCISSERDEYNHFSASFDREFKRLANHYSSFKSDYVSLLDELEQNPQLGTDIGGGLRKIRLRITSKGKGKSGGARGITFTVILSAQEAKLNLLYVYDKAERSSISEKEIIQLLRQNDLL